MDRPGPVGVAALALIALANAAPASSAPGGRRTTISRLAATGLWGFGAWWLATATILLVRYLRQGKLPYGPGLVGVHLPAGAYTLATLSLAARLGHPRPDLDRRSPCSPPWSASGPP